MNTNCSESRRESFFDAETRRRGGNAEKIFEIVLSALISASLRLRVEKEGYQIARE
jgi:hypothetical protein